MALKKKKPLKKLKSLSWTYIILAALIAIMGIAFAFIPDATEIIKQHIDYENPLLFFETEIAIEVIVYLWYFYLARRFADGKSNGILYTVLLIIGVVGSIIATFSGETWNIYSIDFIIDVVALYFIYKAKKSK